MSGSQVENRNDARSRARRLETRHMIRRLDDVNEGVATPRCKPPCKAIKGKQAIIDKRSVGLACRELKGERGRKGGV